eukprot:scaffold89688_cov20-Prasinocladus_malaysianus.AAC.1
MQAKEPKHGDTHAFSYKPDGHSTAHESKILYRSSVCRPKRLNLYTIFQCCGWEIRRLPEINKQRDKLALNHPGSHLPAHNIIGTAVYDLLVPSDSPGRNWALLPHCTRLCPEVLAGGPYYHSFIISAPKSPKSNEHSSSSQHRQQQYTLCCNDERYKTLIMTASKDAEQPKTRTSIPLQLIDMTIKGV